MASLFTGQQLHDFFQDPLFWGNGQSFRNLRLRVDGKDIGADDFLSGWDPSDIPQDACVEVLGGAWEGNGFSLPDHNMVQVVDAWRLGLRPCRIGGPMIASSSDTVPSALAPPSSMPRPSFMRVKDGAMDEVDTPRIKRPSFSF